MPHSDRLRLAEAQQGSYSMTLGSLLRVINTWCHFMIEFRKKNCMARIVFLVWYDYFPRILRVEDSTSLVVSQQCRQLCATGTIFIRWSLLGLCNLETSRQSLNLLTSLMSASCIQVIQLYEFTFMKSLPLLNTECPEYLAMTHITFGSSYT
jgi:hypothetical protein